jgi:hypothetical protein
MTPTHRLTRIIERSAIAVTLGFSFVTPVGAQVAFNATNPHWQAWLGCWQPTDAATTDAPVVCVMPTSAANAVDMVTVDSGKIVSRYTVDASGERHAVTRDGCTGWESARWSLDGSRVFLTSDLTCGALKRTSAGVMSMIPNGEWLTVDAVKAGGNEAVRATHYREATAPANLSPDLASVATLGLRTDRLAAKIATSKPLTAGIVVEATAALDTAAMQAWLVERHEKFSLSAETLVALADAGVPGSVTDVMVAAAYPEEFHFSRSPAPAMGELSPRDSARIAADYLLGRNCDPLSYYSPYGWGVNPCTSYGYRYGYGYPDYRLGYGYGYGYGARGYGYGYGAGYYSGVYSGPVVIVQNGSESEHGRAVKGQGYTRSGGSASGSAGSSSSYAPAGSSNGSSSGSSAGSSSSGSSAGSSSSSGRTAIPRPPL